MQLPTALFLAVGLLGAAAQTQYDEELTVNTTSGRYTGFVDTATPGGGAPDVNQWRGIRYGQAPDDGLHRYARDYPTVCVQQGGNYTGLWWELVPEFQQQDPQGEDCLFLNVWAPRKPVAERVPVVIWVCGGGFQEGGGMRRISYRLNVFGFPGANGAMTNAGFLDARLVVEWAKNNIEAFGGDPERMILWGQSAGAGLTTSYVYANGEDPIIAGAIANSGTVGVGPSSDDDGSSVNKFSQLAEIVGCGGGLDAEAELACMQEVPAQTLQAILQSGREEVPRFGVVVDNTTVFANYTERLEKGLVAKVPLITGTTSNEAAALGGGFDKNATTPPPKSPEDPVGGFDCSLREELKDRLDYGHTTYRYLFAGNFSNITPRYWLGAMHSSDLPLIFGTHYQFRGNSTELEWQTSYAMEDMWVAFATDPSKDPSTSSGLVWPKYSLDGETVVLFGNGTEAAQLAPPSVADISDCSGE
ncbi:triacylglycerol lipase V precursor [Apiospora rasikravindrae]|uniref:Carboxylic ester hydrolase n=1 Tax=Apiospora rasikravindrae TaxID=990691 RepID=A0ABR1RR33_9PEZI